MIVKDILDKISVEYENYELRMSCFTYDYTKENPLVSDTGTLYFDYAICFEIDFNGKCKTFVNELFVYNENSEIMSWDNDDGNSISFNSVIIDDENKLVILV